MTCKIAVHNFSNSTDSPVEVDLQDFLDALSHVTAKRIQEEFNNQAFGARRRSAGLIFKQLVEATLCHRGWKPNQPFFERKVPNLRPSTFSFGKEVNGLKVAVSWGFGNAIGITSVVMSPLFTKNDISSSAWHPNCHVIIVGSTDFNKTLGIDSASASSEQYLAVLSTLQGALPVPTALISVESFQGLKVTETSSPQKITAVELTE